MAAEKRKSQHVPKHEYRQYLVKAKEFGRMMQSAIDGQEWNAAGLMAVHCAISANDAVVAFFGGKRSTSRDHVDAVKILMDCVVTKTTKQNATHLARVIAKKNVIEYESRLFTKAEARAIIDHAEKFLAWAQSMLPKK